MSFEGTETLSHGIDVLLLNPPDDFSGGISVCITLCFEEIARNPLLAKVNDDRSTQYSDDHGRSASGYDDERTRPPNCQDTESGSIG